MRLEARQQRHEFITVEHLLMALLDNPSAAEVLRACSASIDELRKSLAQFIKENTPTVGGSEEVDTQPTLGFQRVIQRAIMHVQSTGSGKKEVTGANVLVAIFGEKDSHAVYFLNQQEITRLDVVNYLSHGIAKHGGSDPVHDEGEAKAAEGGEGEALQQQRRVLGMRQRGADQHEVPRHVRREQAVQGHEAGRVDIAGQCAKADAEEQVAGWNPHQPRRKASRSASPLPAERALRCRVNSCP